MGASNSHKAVAITSDDRRYWIKNTVVMQYSDEQWSLWSLVNNSCIREVFYQYLVNSVDTSVIKIGRAPMTSSKADATAGFRGAMSSAFCPSTTSACVAARFKGQSWMRYNEDDLKRDFKGLGLEPKQARLAGTSRRGLITFPSVEGIIYLLRKKGWMTADELTMEDED